MSRAERLFLACCWRLALHRGGSAERGWREPLAMLTEVLPDIPEPGPGPLDGGVTLRNVAAAAVGRPTALDDHRQLMRIVLLEMAEAEAREAYSAWRADPTGSAHVEFGQGSQGSGEGSEGEVGRRAPSRAGSTGET